MDRKATPPKNPHHVTIKEEGAFMVSKQRQRRSFDREFKRQAIRLVLEDGQSCRAEK
jgi:transposase-like protein